MACPWERGACSKVGTVFKTSDVDTAANVQNDCQHAIHHGPAVCCQSQFMAFSKQSWHFRQRRTVHSSAVPLLQQPVVFYRGVKTACRARISH
eukprot:1163546-Pyramimonas_sp.AAC.1